MADFFGIVNILERGTMSGSSWSRAGSALRLPRRLRPQAASWRAQNIHGSDRASGIAANVMYREFLGSQIRHLIKTPDGRITVDVLHPAGLSLNEEGATVFPSIDNQAAPLLNE